MRFHDDGEVDESLPAGPPPPAVFQAMGEFAADGARNGTLVDQDGYAVLEARSKAEVLHLAKRLMHFTKDHWPGWESKCEVRRLVGFVILIERVAGDDSGGCRGGLAPKVARLIAGLVRIVRDVGLAENLAQDALVAALTQWREIGDPDHPWGLAVTRSSWATLTQCSRDGALRCSDTPNVAN